MTSPPGSLSLVRTWLTTPDPHELGPMYDRLREVGPLVPTPWGGLLITGFDDCKQALAHPDLVTLDSPWRDRHSPAWRRNASTVAMCLSPLLQNPPQHTENRRPIASALAARAIQPLAPAVTRLVHQRVERLVRSVHTRGAAEAAAELSRPLPASIITMLVGLPRRDAPRLADLAHAIMRAAELLRPPDVLRHADLATQQLLLYIDQAIADRLRTPHSDLLSQWAHQASEATRMYVFTLLVGGITTTSAMLGTLCHILLTHPLDTARLQTDQNYRDQLIDEALRWDPPTKVMTRRTTRATDLGGTPLREGQVVHILIGAAHRDPAHFTDPHTFHLARTAKRLQVFGNGIHFCPGFVLARLQATAFVEAFAKHLDHLEVGGIPHRQTGPNSTDLTHLPLQIRPKSVGRLAADQVERLDARAFPSNSPHRQPPAHPAKFTQRGGRTPS